VCGWLQGSQRKFRSRWKIMKVLKEMAYWLLATVLCLCRRSASANESVAGSDLEHRLQLEPNYDVYWSIDDGEITFEVQVATLGYVILALSSNGHFHDADVIVGWIQNGRPRFQVGSYQDFFLFFISSYFNSTLYVIFDRFPMLFHVF